MIELFRTSVKLHISIYSYVYTNLYGVELGCLGLLLWMSWLLLFNINVNVDEVFENLFKFFLFCC